MTHSAERKWPHTLKGTEIRGQGLHYSAFAHTRTILLLLSSSMALSKNTPLPLPLSPQIPLSRHLQHPFLCIYPLEETHTRYPFQTHHNSFLIKHFHIHCSHPLLTTALKSIILTLQDIFPRYSVCAYKLISCLMFQL